MLLAANIGFGLMPIAVKWATTLGYSGIEVTFFRNVFACAAVVALAYVWRQSLRPVNRRAVFWRGLLGGSGGLCFFLALQLTTAAKGTLLYFTSQLWTNFLNVALFGKRPPKGFWLLMAIACLGVWEVLNPDFHAINVGDLVALTSSWLAAGAILANKEARATDNSLTVFGSFSVFGLLLSGAWLLVAFAVPAFAGGNVADWHSPHGAGWTALLVMAMVSTAAQLFFTQGYGYTSIAIGTLLSLSTPVFAAVFSRLLLGEQFTPHFVMGAMLILASSATLVYQERRALDAD